MAAAIEGQDKVLATAQRIVQSLHNTSNTDDMLLILSSFDNRLSTLSSFVSGEENTSNAVIDPRFAEAELVILNEADSSFSDDYLAAVDEIIHLTEEINLNPRAADATDGVMDRAENALQLAMARLEDEFRHILIRNTVAYDTERLHRSSLSSSSSIVATEFFNDDVNENIEDASSGRYSHHGHGRGISFGGEDMSSLDLVHPDAVIDLREIADRMIRSGYEKECCQVYCSVRRDVLDECLAILGVKKLSIEEVQRMEWRSLDDKMRKWIPEVKLVVRDLLSGEKRLCDQIFTGSDLIKEVCFLETSKGCVMQFLNFGEAVAVGRRSAEKLFRILDMYDALAAILPDLQALFMDEDAGDMVCSEAKGVLDALGETAVGTFVEFENAVQGEVSRNPMQNGGIHPLTRYVMNYAKLIVDYSDTLNSLLETLENKSGLEKKNNDNLETSFSLIAQRLLALISSLESNLEEKSRMYEDGAMPYIFLMNNILYIVQKVKDSELRKVLGDNWIKKRRGLIRQHATHYLRAAWSKVLSYLKDEGIGGSSSSATKVALKERFKNFNTCFEDIYRIQTAWKVPDPQLREELRISISEKVIPAYRSFLGRFGSQLESGRHAGKYIKYSPEDLENYLLDLFEGAPLILHHMRRKST
ncbi:exocyst complex component EXO70B1-like [Primulina huaijiensis]|uniref:exocyst complex component EXO70B1-like n=1 Tax=Primulina huaijiensis TaxID=1492673 RepID=UPI003CC6EA31